MRLNKQSFMQFQDIIAVIVLGLLIAILFIIQFVFLIEKANPMATALYNALQFILTIGFTWFSTRAISRKEFEDGMKRYGNGAYRRIYDISVMLNRLHEKAVEGLNDSEGYERNTLKVIDAIIEDTR
jgi:hypothetical protein